ncbi:hypothetical protein [Flavisolibacter tropicus]|uniref:Uncharacterized protein n=1 Tax=Flavisolibacter tropicus TaxID=1492898 RepID=A0A172U1A6_9BACT|nr:hypothetical protein [Flavisolibacter tropicus]ANE53139.1 hypothetical protein SY85_24365 [Flavisolibacter tropicus]
MEEGQYYNQNHQRIGTLQDRDWAVALGKAKEHIRLRLRQKTSFGAHHSTNLGADAIDHYLSIGYTKILSGEWEWKESHTLAEQMILIIDSYISKEVKRYKGLPEDTVRVEYRDDLETSFYDNTDEDDTEEVQEECNRQVQLIEAAIQDDAELVMFWEGVKEGYKARDIASLLDITVKQLSKLREKFFRRVRNFQTKGA